MPGFARVASTVLALTALVAYALPAGHHHRHKRRRHGHLKPRVPAAGSTANCTYIYVEQPLSHFLRGVTDQSFQQRLCVYSQYWKGGNSPIFFYTGNEDPVDEYVNGTGQMWELGPKFGALLVWAEHRYFGESVPKMAGVRDCLAYLTIEEALADYAALVGKFRYDNSWQYYAPEAPVIAFGGSYGGELTAWFRMRYPSHVDGGICASGPILGFPHENPPLDAAAVALTAAVTEAGGAPKSCLPNLKAAWVLLNDAGKTEAGRKLLSERMGLCAPLESEGDVAALTDYLHDPWFQLAEGDYPFSSDYITFDASGGDTSALPAWPMRKVCEPISQDFGVSLHGDVEKVKFGVRAGAVEVSVDWDKTTNNGYSVEDLKASRALDLLAAVVKGLNVWYNVTGKETCLAWNSDDGDDDSDSTDDKADLGDPENRICGSKPWDHSIAWDALVCNAGHNMVGTWAHGMGRDLYWPPNIDRNMTYKSAVEGPHYISDCDSYRKMGLYGVPEKSDYWGNWLDELYGGQRIKSYSNIFFSNGGLDPWSSAGVAPPGPTPDLPAAIVKMGGHHLDLFPTHEDDPPSVREVRALQQKYIEKWVREAQGPAAMLAPTIPQADGFGLAATSPVVQEGTNARLLFGLCTASAFAAFALFSFSARRSASRSSGDGSDLEGLTTPYMRS